MGLDIGSLKATGVYVGGVPATGVYVGEEKIWPTGPRVVTIPTNYSTWMPDAMTGDVSMISGFSDQWTVTFEVPVVCDRAVNVNRTATNAGGRIEAGALVTVRSRDMTHTFTEIL